MIELSKFNIIGWFYSCSFRSTSPQKKLRRPLVPPAPLKRASTAPVPTIQVPRDTTSRVELVQEDGATDAGCNPILTGCLNGLVEHNPTRIGQSTPILDEYNPTSPISSSRYEPTTSVARLSLARYLTNSYSICKL